MGETKKVSRKAKVFVVIILGLVVGPVTYYIVSGLINYQDKVLNNEGGLFETSATILAFFSLSSVLGARLSAHRDRSVAQAAILSIILICGIVVIVLQASVIVWLCCFELYASTYIGVMAVTVFCFIVVAFVTMMFIFMDTYSESDLKPS